jgi:hypothetical protein
MAAYFGDTTDLLGHSLAVPVLSYTVCGLAQIESNTGAVQTIALTTTDGVSASLLLMWRSAGVDSMLIGSYDPDQPTNDTALGSRPALDTPFFWFMRCAGSGAGQVTGGWGYLDGTAMVTATVTAASDLAANPNTIATYFGGTGTNHCDAHMAGLRSFVGALTDAQLENERYMMYPVSYGAEGVIFHPMWDAAGDHLTDYSGNGGNLIVAGTAPNVSDIAFPVRIRNRRAGRAIFGTSPPPPSSGLAWFRF